MRQSVRDARRAAPLDHEQDLVVSCDMWVQALAAPSTWDDGVDGALLCHLLFSVHDEPTAHGAAMLRFRCGPVHGQHGTKTNYWCHKLNMPRIVPRPARRRTQHREMKEFQNVHFCQVRDLISAASLILCPFFLKVSRR